MKRKPLILLALILCLTPIFGLVGCGSDADLSYDVRYICDDNNLRSEDDYKKTYLKFSDNDYGIYHYYYNSELSGILDYTIKFKYTYLDEDKSTVACFYDSISYGAKHTDSKTDRSNWSPIYTVSKNVVMSLDGTTYINEEYLNEEISEYKKV